MYRTLITTFVIAFMVSGAATGVEPFFGENGYNGSIMSIDSEGQFTSTSDGQSTAMTDDENLADEKSVDEKSVDEKSADEKSEATVQVKRRRFVHRLPNYFSTVVTDEQKEEIYTIQDEYAPKIREYHDKLTAALKERNAKINALLTPEQHAKIEQMKEATKARRKAARKARARKVTSIKAK